MMWKLLLLLLERTPCLNSISLLVTKQLECRPLICKTLHPCLHSPFRLSLSDSLSWANRSGSGTALIHNGQVQTKSHVWRDVFICMSVSPPVELVAGRGSTSLYMQLVSGVMLSACWIGGLFSTSAFSFLLKVNPLKYCDYPTSYTTQH